MAKNGLLSPPTRSGDSIRETLDHPPLVVMDVFIKLFQEDGDPISVQVVREGGSLVTRYIEYFTTPGDPDEEFYGGIGVLKFEANENYKEATLIARTDGVPEVLH